MSLKRVIQRGGGYARRRDRCRFDNAPFHPTDEEFRKANKKSQELLWNVTICIFLFFLLCSGFAGLVWLWQKLMFALGLD